MGLPRNVDLTASNAEERVVEALHHHTSLCAGADTCTAREILEPILRERDLYRAACYTIKGPATEGDPFIEEYRSANGGYSGLQAIAAAAIWEVEGDG